METPFIVKRMLEDTIAGLKYEIERGDTYTVEQRDFMADIRSALGKFLKAESDAEFAKKYPEHMKQDKVRDEGQAIGLFIETGGWLLCTWPDGESHPRPTNLSINQVLADYFEIDLKVLENEKQQMLDELASSNIG